MGIIYPRQESGTFNKKPKGNVKPATMFLNELNLTRSHNLLSTHYWKYYV